MRCLSNATPPTIRTALTISRPQNCERNAPNLLAHYLYLWELTAIRQAVETAWISASVRRTFIELLVPAGSSSSLGQAGETGRTHRHLVGILLLPSTRAMANGNISTPSERFRTTSPYFQLASRSRWQGRLGSSPSHLSRKRCGRPLWPPKAKVRRTTSSGTSG